MLLVYVACPDADIYHMKRPRFELVPKVIPRNRRFSICRDLVVTEKRVSTVRGVVIMIVTTVIYIYIYIYTYIGLYIYIYIYIHIYR